MTIIQKYVVREIHTYFGIVLAAVVGIFLTVDFFEKIDNFISSALPPMKAVSFFFFKIPLIVSQVLPLSLLISVLIALGMMNRNNEFTVMKSCGIGMVQVLKPVMSVGLVWTLMLFILSESIVPLTAPRANRIWIEEVKKKQMVATREKNIWIRSKNMFIHIKHCQFSGEDIIAHGISLYSFDRDFRLQGRVDAKSAIFADGVWQMTEVMEQSRNADGGIDAKIHDHMALPLELSPEDLRVVMKKSEEMSWAELLRYIQKTEGEGYDASRLKVDLAAKIAFPCVCVIMCLVGTAVGIGKGIREGLPVGVAYGIGIAFLYWMLYSFCLSLGYGGLLPPLISAWTANLMFAFWGIYLFVSRAF